MGCHGATVDRKSQWRPLFLISLPFFVPLIHFLVVHSFIMSHIMLPLPLTFRLGLSFDFKLSGNTLIGTVVGLLGNSISSQIDSEDHLHLQL